MSSPSTPSSTRSSAERGSASPAPAGQLTPRSKVRALLAGFDDSDEEESPVKAKDQSPNHTAVVQRTVSDIPSQQSQDTLEDEARKDTSRRKGKLVSQMLGNESSSEDENTGFSAYARIRQQLAKSKATPQRSRADSEDDDDVPIRPRGRISRALQVEPPTASANNTSDGEGISAAVLSRHSSEDVVTEDEEAVRPRLLRRKMLTRKKTKSPSVHGPQSPSMRQDSPASMLGSLPLKAKSPPFQNSDDDADSNLPEDPEKDSAFQARVARQRQERVARQRAENAEQRARRVVEDVVGSETSGEDEEAFAKKVTQESRPTRKASKKALEEMNRETQRMSRNMQLAHEARTKKKISKESFLARFRYGHPTDAVKDPNSSTTVSSAPASDGEVVKDKDTPPTSPLRPDSQEKQPFQSEAKITAAESDIPAFISNFSAVREDEDIDLPTIQEVFSKPISKLDKGKGKVSDVAEYEKLEQAKRALRPSKIRIKSPNLANDDSDSDLEIVRAPKGRLAHLFDRIPAQKNKESNAAQLQRALAHVFSPSKGKRKREHFMTVNELDLSLRKQASLQAAQEKAERIQQLRDRGVEIQTAEERERDQAELEDLFERAKQDAEALAKREKEAAKKEGKEMVGSGFEDSSDDEDYVDEEDHDEALDDAEPEFSGSEDEDHEASEEEEINEGNGHHIDTAPAGLLEEEAEVGGEEQAGTESEPQKLQEEFSADEEDLSPMVNRRRTAARVISDDESDDDRTQPLSTIQHSAKKLANPGLGVSEDLPMGLTQAFAATMDDSQLPTTQENEQDQDSLAWLRRLPPVDLPEVDLLPADSQEIVRDSQAQETEDPEPYQIRLGDSQLQSREPESDTFGGTQISEMPDPTQDQGFTMSSAVSRRFRSVPPSVAGQRFGSVPPATISTVLLEPESPVAKKRNRLRTRAEALAELSDVDEDNNEDSVRAQDNVGKFAISANAFDLLRKGAGKRKVEAPTFDKKMSNAKGMVEEQAEESEDEYAGLGGASEDDSNSEADEEVLKMINDDGSERVDERKLAAFYAYVFNPQSPFRLSRPSTN